MMKLLDHVRVSCLFAEVHGFLQEALVSFWNLRRVGILLGSSSGFVSVVQFQLFLRPHLPVSAPEVSSDFFANGSRSKTSYVLVEGHESKLANDGIVLLQVLNPGVEIMPCVIL